MKTKQTIIAILMALFSIGASAQFITSDSAAIYLDPFTFKTRAHFSRDINGDTVLFSIFEMNNFWHAPFVVACGGGNYVDPNDDGKIVIPGLIGLTVSDPCFSAFNYVQVDTSVQMTSDEQTPYTKDDGGAIHNVYTDPNSDLYSPQTWADIISFATPPTSIVDVPYTEFGWPGTDCATGFSAGYRWGYWGWIPFNHPDGVYTVDISFNYPAGIVSAGAWPLTRTLWMWKHAGQITWLDSLNCSPRILSSCTEPVPPAPQNITLSRTNLLGWDMVPGADSYTVYAQMAYQDHGWMWYDSYTVIADDVVGNRFQIPTLPNTFWRFYVTAKNCAGVSPYSEPSKKDKQ